MNLIDALTFGGYLYLLLHWLRHRHFMCAYLSLLSVWLLHIAGQVPGEFIGPLRMSTVFHVFGIVYGVLSGVLWSIRANRTEVE